MCKKGDEGSEGDIPTYISHILRCVVSCVASPALRSRALRAMCCVPLRLYR